MVKWSCCFQVLVAKEKCLSQAETEISCKCYEQWSAGRKTGRVTQTPVAPAPAHPLTQEGQQDDRDKLFELFKTFFPFLLCQPILLVGVIGGY